MESEPTNLDEFRSQRHQRAVNLVESPIFKMAQMAITIFLAVAIPLAGWAMNTVVSKLTSIETAMNQYATSSAVNELRLQRVERDTTKSQADIRALENSQARQDYDIGRLDDRPKASK